MKDKVILHVDLNNFYASVEAILNPALVGKAIAVCGDPDRRCGIVLAKSEPAKKMGVKTGDVIWQAKQKCPDIIIVPASHGVYGEYSKKVQEIYCRYTERVEAFGGDECWLDVTDSLKLLKKNGREIADEIRSIVKSELGLSVSVGVSWNKTYAKLGSDYKKPDATTEITPDNYSDIVFAMPVANMLYVGRKSIRLFEKLGIKTIGDLAGFDVDLLRSHIGITAVALIEAARGEDNSQVAPYYHKRVVKSVGNGTTVPKDLVNQRQVEQVMYLLAEEVAYRLRKKGLKGFTVNLSIKSPDMSWVGAQESVKIATNSVNKILQACSGILDKLWDRKPVRALRIAVSNLTSDTRQQLDFLEETVDSDKEDKLSALFDTVRRKYGVNSIYYGIHHKSGHDMQFEVFDE